MTESLLTPDAAADIRWREWQIRGAEKDLRSATAMTGLSVVLAISVAVFLLYQLVL
jgi:hypothetical protein